MKLVDTKDAVGTVLCHDITQIIKGVTKDARFRKGHVVKEEDIPAIAKDALNDVCTPGNPRDTTLEEIIELYRSLM